MAELSATANYAESPVAASLVPSCCPDAGEFVARPAQEQSIGTTSISCVDCLHSLLCLGSSVLCLVPTVQCATLIVRS